MPKSVERTVSVEKPTLTIKGKLSSAAMPVEIGLSLPCMAEIRKWIGGEVVVEDGQLMWRPDNLDDFSETD